MFGKYILMLRSMKSRRLNARAKARACQTASALVFGLLIHMPFTAQGWAASLEEEGADGPKNRSIVEEIIVTEDRKGSMTAPGLEEARRRMTRISGAVDLVAAEEFGQEYVEHLGDMLRMTPGVLAQERYSEEIRLSIRGSGLGLNFHLRGVELLLDGTPINFSDGFGDFQEIDSRLVRYLEVYKGGNGFDFGAASLGGAINVVSPTGRTAADANSLMVEGGSFGTAKVTGMMARAGDDWDFFAGATGVHSDQFRDHSTQITGRFTTNVGIKLSEQVETRFYLIANHINQEIPGSLDFDTALTDRKQAVQNNIDNDWARNIRSLRLINKTSVQMGASGQLDFGAYGTIRDLDHPIFVFIDDEVRDYGLFGRYTDSLSLAGLRHDITLGMTARRSTIDDDWFVNEGGRRGFHIQSTQQDASIIQGYATDQIYLTDTFALDLGLQAFATKRDYTDNFDPINDDVVNYSALNPKFGLLWDVAPRTQIWTNITKSAEPPAFSELVQRPILQFVELEKQTSWTAEVGTRGAMGPLAWDVTLYRAWIEGEFLRFAIDGNIPANSFNADDTIHQGLEAGLHLTAAEGLFGRDDTRLIIEGAYTLSDFFFQNDEQFGNNQLAVTVRHLLNAEVRLEEPDRFHIAMTLEWAPKAPWVDFANTLRATDYAVFGLKAGATIADGLEFYANVQNITNKRYISTFSNVIDASVDGTALNVFTPGDGIGVFAGIKASF
ncbi:TonB-dependent receptor [Iodidimonas gelatinilytica]|uniref:TonB-dependent receptor n=2 Tax=Iodidimonas gelatinilytica TaxID=1236966 RepID=A0A5A7MZH4_9PROT|nr:TonB-dependent receptor [Iodidimonas gelatinilytica]